MVRRGALTAGGVEVPIGQCLTRTVLRELHSLRDSAERIAKEAEAIARVPAPTFHEGDRAAKVKALIGEVGLANADIDQAGNATGWIGDVRETRNTLVVCAHLDCAYPPGTEVEVRRDGPMMSGRGIGDNSSSIAATLAAVRALRRARLAFARPALFAATVGEEGEGGLRGIRHLLDRLGARVSEVISVDGRLGSIVTRAIAVRRHRITVRGQGGHSWADYGRPSANAGLVRIANAICRIRPPKRPRTTLNVGVLRGGSSVNAISAEASLDLDLRSESPEMLTRVERKALALTSEAGAGLRVETELIDERPWGECPEGCSLVRDACRALKEIGIAPREAAGSTEANMPLSRGIPAIAFGVVRSHGAHSPAEHVEVRSLGQGAAALLALLALRVGAEPTAP